MQTLNIVEIATAIFAVITIALILMNQPQNADTFGAKDSFMHVRRGFERQIHSMAVGSSVILLCLVVLSLIVK